MKHSVDHFHTNALLARAFQPALGRECGLALQPPLRPKPHPDALLHICSLWNLPPHEVAFVGDSPKDDVSCCLTPPNTALLLLPAVSNGLLSEVYAIASQAVQSFPAASLVGFPG